MGWVISLFGSSLSKVRTILLSLIAAITIFLSVVGKAYFKGKSDANRDTELKSREELDKKEKEVLDVIRETQGNTDGLSSVDVIDSLRRNDGDWGRM